MVNDSYWMIDGLNHTTPSSDVRFRHCNGGNSGRDGVPGCFGVVGLKTLREGHCGASVVTGLLIDGGFQNIREYQ